MCPAIWRSVVIMPLLVLRISYKYLFLILIVGIVGGVGGPSSALGDEALVKAPSKPAHPRIEQRLQRLLRYEPGATIQQPLQASGWLQVILLYSGPVTAADREALETLGGKVQLTLGSQLQALLPSDRVTAAADLPRVQHIRLPQQARPKRVGEGRAALEADRLLASGVDGSGVGVAVLDVGFAGYRNLLGSELPTVVQTRSFNFSGGLESTEHGTAVAEIIHDMAPGADLTLVAFGNDLEYLAALDWLEEAGIPIVSASIGFDNINSLDGTGPLARAASRLYEQADVLYINAVGNEQQSYWTGRFTDTDRDGFHEFAAGDQTLSVSWNAGETLSLKLNWDDWGDDPDLPEADQDYDLYVWCPDTAVLTPDTACLSSNDFQEGQPGHAPFEEITRLILFGGVFQVGIQRFTPGQANHRLRLLVQSCTAGGCDKAPMEYQTPSATLAHPAEGLGVLAVGAFDVAQGGYEDFSSQGPTWDGRIKPDLAGPVNVTSVVFGNRLFSGTSAAAPHVAGLAALLKAQDPRRDAQQLRHLLLATSLDQDSLGKDNLWGAGKVRGGALADKPKLSPLSGHWYDPGQDGHGFFMDIQGDTVVAAWYVYDRNGVPLWLLAVLTRQEGERFQGEPRSFRGPIPTTPLSALFDAEGGTRDSQSVGVLTVTFTETHRASAELDLRGDNLTAPLRETLQLQRLAFDGVADDLDGATPYLDSRFGLWGNEDQNGHGFFIDVQNQTVVMAWYIYDPQTGDPFWVLAVGDLQDGVRATAQAYVYTGPALIDGLSLAEAFATDGGSAVTAEAAGTVDITFHDHRTATVVLNQVLGLTDTIELRRFEF